MRGGRSRGDLEDLGDTLDAGTTAIIVVGTTSLADELAEATTRATKRIERRLNADARGFQEELATAATAAG